MRDEGHVAIASKSAIRNSDVGVQSDMRPSIAVVSRPPCSRSRGCFATPASPRHVERASESMSTRVHLAMSG